MTPDETSPPISDESTSKVQIALPHKVKKRGLWTEGILELLTTNLDVIQAAQWVAGLVQLQIDVLEILGR